jgi:thioredoxin 2
VTESNAALVLLHGRAWSLMRTSAAGADVAHRSGNNEAVASGLIRCGPCGQANRVPTAAAGTPRCGKYHQPLPWIADADDTTFSEVAEAARIPVIVDLWAPWYRPCRMISPALEQLARDLAGQVKLVKVNVDTSPQISQRFRAQAISTLLVLRQPSGGQGSGPDGT